jgi:predicted O-linked N-acetylglucosamine transferase (SPINDLY family)
MEILKRNHDSVIWLVSSNDLHRNNIHREAEKFGISQDRIIFASYLTYDEHLNRIKLADIFLDTLPYNAGVSASDALRMGVPVISRLGKTFAGRMCASLLKALNLDELIVESESEYIDLAIKLSLDPSELIKIKDKLKNAVIKNDLYSTQTFVENIESVFIRIYRDSLAVQ